MEETLEILQDNLGQALIDTAYMVVVSAIIGVVLGTLVALLLYLTENRLFTPNHALNVIVGFIVNAIRSLPFLILMVVLIPVVQLILGDPYTPTGGAISLSIAAVPFFARIAESAFSEVDPACLKLPSPLVPPHAKSLWMRYSLSLAVVHSWCGAHHYFTDWLFRNGRNDRRWRHRRYGHSIRL